MFLKKLKSLFHKKKSDSLEVTDVGINHSASISFWTAGIKFDSRLENLLECRVKEPVYLIREPDNEIDTNAIHVMTKNNKSLGFVGKNRAAFLAQMLDSKEIENVGYIVTIQSDLKNELYGIKISLPVREEIISKVKRDKSKEIDSVFELSSNGNLYLLLNCSENILEDVKSILEKAGIEIGRTGISFALSTSGKNYKWYIRIDNDSDQLKIEQLLRQNFPYLQEKYDNQFNQEYVELQEEELQNLESQRIAYEERIKEFEKSLENFGKREDVYNHQFEKMTAIFLPEVIFIRDSMDVLKNEISDYTTALKKIQELYLDPLLRGKKIHSLTKWFEIHFNTGQRDDGRIYFKREGLQLHVLVSFKASQKKDIEFLRMQ